jgi:hypothetical protein
MTTTEKASYDASVLQLVGISAGSGAVKAYVDATAAGLSAKPSVVVSAITNLTLSGEQTVDGVLTSASRILLTGQTSGIENGIYVTGAGAWTRATDMAATSGASGAFVLVERGTARAGSAWVCTTAAGSDVVGVNSLTFVEFDIGAITFTKVNAALATANASIAVNSQKITSLANGSAATDGAAFGQIPVVATATPSDVTYPAAVGTGTKWAAEDHTHQMARSAARMGFRCDFAAANTANFVAATLYVGTMGEPGWIGTNANSATGLTLNANSATEIGTLLLSTGSNTAGACTAVTSAGNGGQTVTPTSANPLFFEVKFACADAVSDGVNTYKIIVGLSDTLNAAPANGFWAEVDANSDTHILVKTCSGGAGNVVTAVTSSVVMGTATYHTFKVVKPAGSLTCNIFLDGTLVGAGAMPTNLMSPTLEIIKSAGGTARRLAVDWFDMEQVWATPRT